MEFFHWVQVILNNYGILLLRGTAITVLLAIVGTLVGFLIGLLIGVYKTLPIRKEDPLLKRILYKVFNFLLSAYIEVFRSTPMMVQATVIFYGAAFLFSLRLDPITAGMFIISINTGAYMAETVRGGILSIDLGQTEGAKAIGMTHVQTMLYVILPQALRNIMPQIGNNLIINIKDSCVLSVIGVAELLYKTKSAAGALYMNFETYTITMIVYFIMTFTCSRILRWLENRMDGSDNYDLATTDTLAHTSGMYRYEEKKKEEE